MIIYANSTISSLRERYGKEPITISKTLKFAKIRCKCGHTNLIPIIEVFHVFESVKCEKCGKVIAGPKQSN